MKSNRWFGCGLLFLTAASFAQEPAEPLDTLPVTTVEEPAPSPADEAPTQLDTIVVTGEKLGRTLAETTTSVGLFTREALDAGSDAAMKDVVSQFANVVSAGGDREIAIRGVPLNGIGGEGETISVYLDGVALPAQAARFAGPLTAWDLEQVEVLRGAQSTNQGRSSLAGSVVLRSREPTTYWDGRLRVTRFSRDSHDYAIAGGGPLSDTLGFRIAAQDRYDRGEVTNITRNEDDAGREVTRNGRFKLAWQPFDDYRAQYGYTRAKNQFGDPLHDTAQGERTELSSVRGNEDDRSHLHSLEQRYALDDAWRLESISGLAGISNLYTIDFDRSAADGGYSDNTLDEDVFSQELRLGFSETGFRAVAGVYYADSRKATRTVGYDVAAGGGAALINGFVNSDSTLRTQALFAEADWDFAERWRLTAGARLNDERAQRFDASDLELTLAVPAALLGLPFEVPVGVPLPDAVTDELSTAQPNLVPPDYEESGRTRFRDVLPKLGLTRFIGEASLVALTYQEGYRSGGTSVSFFGGGANPFEPEYTQTVELAGRTRTLDDRLALNTNVFYTKWRDQQVTIGETSGFATTTENAGRSHSYGLEAEALWNTDTPIEIFATLGLLRTAFDEFSNDGEDYAGNEFPYAPRRTAGLGFTVRDWNRFSGQIGGQYIGAVYSDPDNDPRSQAPSRALLNARLGYRVWKGLSVSIYGRNLTDNLNKQGALVVPGGADTVVPGTDIVVMEGTPTRIANRYGEARSVGVQLEWQL